jgi:hypothetical protein
MATKLYSRSFGGGIIGPEMLGRIDDVKYATGLRDCRNFLVLPQGPIEARPGTKFVREVRNSAQVTRLIPFRFSTTQTTVLEFGAGYIRFHTFGGTVFSSAAGLSAWDALTAYPVGSLVTAGGRIWYAAVATTGDDPTVTGNQFIPSPTVSTAWSETVAPSLTPPPGYTNVGSTLPLTVVVGQQVYISQIETFFVPSIDPFSGFSSVDGPTTEITIITYIGYTGVSVSSPTGFWIDQGEVAPAVPVPLEISSPYAEGDLMSLTYVQSGDILTVCHPRYPPHELRRLGATQWIMVPVTFGSTLAAPTIAAVTPTLASSPSDTQVYSYVATSITDDQLDESVASAASTATNQLFDTGASNEITFATAARRNVYKLSGGIHGFIGQTTTTSLVDDNIAADVSRAPPINQNPFVSDYPGAVGYFEQRRVFAGTPLLPQTFWMTRSGLESNLDYSIPVRDDDAISVRLAAREASIIRHIVPVGELLILTDSAEWVVSSGGSGPITPFSISLRPQSYIGASQVQPVVVGTSALYVAARGGHVRAAGYDFDVQSYVSIDMSLRAAHLFDFKTVVDMAYAKGPTPIVWAVSSDGSLLGMTYVPEQQVYAWHRHFTARGTYESVCVVGEGNDDVLYAVVRRPILSTLALVSFIRTGATVTITTSGPHLMRTGQTITVSGAEPAGYNGDFVITVTSPTTMTFDLPPQIVPIITRDEDTILTRSGDTVIARDVPIGPIVVRGERFLRYIEQMQSRFFSTQRDYFGVDCGLTYAGAPATTISGLGHIEGREVTIYSDGAVLASRTVSQGQIVLDTPVTYAHIGLPIDAYAETLPVAAEIEAYAQATIKNINKVTLRVANSGAFFAGPDLAHLIEAKIRTNEPYGTPPVLQTREIEVLVTPTWQQDGRVMIRRQTPTPLTVTSMTVELQMGG